VSQSLHELAREVQVSCERTNDALAQGRTGPELAELLDELQDRAGVLATAVEEGVEEHQAVMYDRRGRVVSEEAMRGERAARRWAEEDAEEHPDYRTEVQRRFVTNWETVATYGRPTQSTTEGRQT
jgi:hypothetical protein